MSSYIGNRPVLSVRQDFVYTASAGQTVFSGVDSVGLNLVINGSNFDVFVNGVLLSRNDLASSSSTSVTLADARRVGDVVTVRNYGFIESVGVVPVLARRGHISGLTLSNNATDAVNDIDVSVGECASTETNPVVMSLTSGITKRLDAAWAAGTGNGGLDTGSIANGWYHVWLIQRSDTGAVDALFSASATSPTMPANYDRKRRIGSVSRESAALVSFRQFGDVFERVPIQSLNSTGAFTSTLISLNVPTGIVVQPMLSSVLSVNTSSVVSFSLGSAWAGSSNIFWHAANGSGGTQNDAKVLSGGIFTNTSAQIYMARTVSSGTVASHSINTNGWIDDRGKN